LTGKAIAGIWFPFQPGREKNLTIGLFFEKKLPANLVNYVGA
jgi:hypothetical protein